MSAQLLRPGLTFEALLMPEASHALHRTPSVYQYSLDLETVPSKGCYYVVCNDYSIQSVFEPTRPIGWELLEDGGDFYYRVTQHGFSPEKITMIFVGYEDDPPAGTGTTSRAPQDAVIIDFEDDGEPEVTSSLKCPGAPRKAPNPFF